MTNRFVVVLWFASLAPCVALGQQASSDATPNFTIDQAVTCSVHDAWVLGGKTEAGFFAIVQAEAELAAQKRGLVLPDSEAVGRQFGDYIKAQAPEMLAMTQKVWFSSFCIFSAPKKMKTAMAISITEKKMPAVPLKDCM